MIENKQLVSQRLKRVRLHLGLKSKDFAAGANIDPRNYSSIESGSRSIGERIVRDICNSYNINYEWAVNGSGEMFNNDDKTSFDGEQSSKDDVLMSRDAMEIIKMQAASLERKDRQIDEVIKMHADVVELLRDQIKQNKKAATAVPADDRAECADASGSDFAAKNTK